MENWPAFNSNASLFGVILCILIIVTGLVLLFIRLLLLVIVFVFLVLSFARLALVGLL